MAHKSDERFKHGARMWQTTDRQPTLRSNAGRIACAARAIPHKTSSFSPSFKDTFPDFSIENARFSFVWLRVDVTLLLSLIDRSHRWVLTTLQAGLVHSDQLNSTHLIRRRELKSKRDRKLRLFDRRDFRCSKISMLPQNANFSSPNGLTISAKRFSDNFPTAQNLEVMCATNHRWILLRANWFSIQCDASAR